MGQLRRKTPAVFDRALGEWQPPSQYISFPEFQEPPAPANPVIPFRTRLLSELETEPRPVLPYFFPLIPFIPEAPANPLIGLRYGQWLGDEVAPLFVRPEYQRFTYFQEAASPVIAFRYGQWIGDAVEPLIGILPRHLPFPYIGPQANPAIPFRYGSPPLVDDPTVLVWARYLAMVAPTVTAEGEMAPSYRWAGSNRRRQRSGRR